MCQGRSSGREPAEQGPLGGPPIGHRTLLRTLAEYPYQAPVPIDVGQVKSTQFGDTDTGRIQQFHHRIVTQGNGITLRSAQLRSP